MILWFLLIPKSLPYRDEGMIMPYLVMHVITADLSVSVRFVVSLISFFIHRYKLAYHGVILRYPADPNRHRFQTPCILPALNLPLALVPGKMMGQGLVGGLAKSSSLQDNIFY